MNMNFTGTTAKHTRNARFPQENHFEEEHSIVKDKISATAEHLVNKIPMVNPTMRKILQYPHFIRGYGTSTSNSITNDNNSQITCHNIHIEQ
jgi:hypothetical protein